MATEAKVSAIAEIKERLEQHSFVMLTKYSGIDSEQVTNLRRMLRDNNVEYKVYKNTLGKRALDELGLGELAQHMDGPTAWAFCDEPVGPTKVFKDFSKDVKCVEMTAGLLDGNIVNQAQLNELASLPSREQLIAQVVGVLAAPISGMLGVFNGVQREFVSVVDQVRKQKEEQDAA